MNKSYFDNDLEFISVFKQLTQGKSNRSVFEKKILAFAHRWKDSEHPEKLFFWEAHSERVVFKEFCFRDIGMAQVGRKVTKDDLPGMYVLLALHYDFVSKEADFLPFDINLLASDPIDLELFRSKGMALHLLPSQYEDMVRDIQDANPRGLGGMYQRHKLPLDSKTRGERRKEMNKYLQLAVEWVCKDRGIILIEDGQTIKAGKKQGGSKQGRPRKYTDQQLEAMYKIYEDEIRSNGGHSRSAWNKVAGTYKIKTGDAARIACMEYRKKLK